jgi:hypothetical protein
VSGSGVIAATVPNSWHLGHLPTQRGACAPHEEHSKVVADLAMSPQR